MCLSLSILSILPSKSILSLLIFLSSSLSFFLSISFLSNLPIYLSIAGTLALNPRHLFKLATPCQDKEGATPLILAAVGGHLRIAQLLVGLGANLDHQVRLLVTHSENSLISKLFLFICLSKVIEEH